MNNELSFFKYLTDTYPAGQPFYYTRYPIFKKLDPQYLVKVDTRPQPNVIVIVDNYLMVIDLNDVQLFCSSNLICIFRLYLKLVV